MDQPQRRTTRWPLAVTAIMAVLAFGLAASLAVVFTLWGQVGRLQARVNTLRLELTQRELQRLGETPTPPVTTTEIPDQPVLSVRVTKPVAADVSWPTTEAGLLDQLRKKLASAAHQPYLLADRQSDVRWLESSQEVPLTEENIRHLFGASQSDDVNNGVGAFSSIEQIGVFVSGSYAGKQAVLLVDDSGMGSTRIFFARDPSTGSGVMLPNYPFDEDNQPFAKVKIDSAYHFSDLEYPKTVDLLPGLKLHQIGSSWGSAPLDPTDDFLVAEQSVIGDLYYGLASHNFFVMSITGNAVAYENDIPFRRSTARGGYYQVEPYQLNWWYGSSTDEYYSTTPGGCGSLDNRAVVTGVAPSQLVQAGMTGTGDPMYEFADAGAEPLRKLYQEWYVPFETQKASYEEFLLAHPIFFWQDEFGRLVRFISGNFFSGAECGKPAIYLYPTKQQAVHVEVDPRGGFTHTEPPYGSGWEVVASPDGTLRDQATGKTYGYLWWDGRGGLYQAPEKYWVVAQADVEGFLLATLPKLGLNGHESADFLEYWLPYFSAEHPYYRIGFHGTSVMDALAPLTITPTPDQVIRILMDYEGLNAPASSNPPRVVTPRRIGFTVIEWGGVRH